MIFFFWLVIGGIVGAIIQQSKSGSAGTGCLLGALLGPIGWLIIYLTSGKQCPYCRSSIHKAATRCPKCSKDIETQNSDNSLSIPFDKR